MTRLDYYICSAFVLRVYYMIITVLPLFRENSRKFEKVGEDRRRLEKVGEGWMKFEKVGEGWMKAGRRTYVKSGRCTFPRGSQAPGSVRRTFRVSSMCAERALPPR